MIDVFEYSFNMSKHSGCMPNNAPASIVCCAFVDESQCQIAFLSIFLWPCSEIAIYLNSKHCTLNTFGIVLSNKNVDISAGQHVG